MFKFPRLNSAVNCFHCTSKTIWLAALISLVQSTTPKWNISTDHHECVFRYSWSPEDESFRLWWSSDFFHLAPPRSPFLKTYPVTYSWSPEDPFSWPKQSFEFSTMGLTFTFYSEMSRQPLNGLALNFGTMVTRECRLTSDHLTFISKQVRLWLKSILL